MEKENLEYWADVLHGARIKAKPIQQISREITSFSRENAYAVQEIQRSLRLKSGEIQVGWKMGLTSEAKRKQMNLDSPLYGHLTNVMQIEDRGAFSLKGSIHPKIEPEIAFLISKDLKGPHVTRDQVLNACEGVAAALEILDSRYEQFRYFSMEDVIADNSSSSHFVVGPWERNFKNLDLVHLKMEMSLDHQVVQTGKSSDISGDPVISVIQLCELLHQHGQFLTAGSIVLAGAATVAEALKPGMKFDLTVSSLQPVQVKIQE